MMPNDGDAQKALEIAAANFSFQVAILQSLIKAQVVDVEAMRT